MSANSFAHLHVHTEYSMLDGASRVEELLDAAAEDGQPACAITDHGVLFGLVDFYRAARQRGITPILGCELYQALGSRFDRERRSDGVEPYVHLTALAANDTGYQNLMSLATYASLEGHHYKPRVDKELLSQYSEGLIVLSGCLGSEVNQALVRGEDDVARRALGEFADIFGPDRFFVEIMDHEVPLEREIQPRLLELAATMNLRVVATNDSHYTKAEDATAHDAILCVGTGSEIADENRFRFTGSGYWLRSAKQMRELFADRPDACDATLDIAEQIETKLSFGLDLLPEFPCPEGMTESEFLRQKVLEGARERYGPELAEPVRVRLDYELGVIEQMGFPAYFLIVADLVEHATAEGIRVGPGRGSAGGSAVAYCTGITRIDPIEYGLIFDRFLNPGRDKSMPDIDIDFDDRRRGEMIRYVANRYGEDHVAQIVTFATIKAKSALRDSARVLGHPYALGDRLTKSMPPAVMGREKTLAEGMKQSAELRDAVENDPAAREVFETATKLEGLHRQHGVHAAAVVIGPRPLREIVPLMRTDRDDTITQYEMHAIEDIGLLKMDFLGLRNLTVISDAQAHIQANRGVAIDVDELSLDDAKTYKMLTEGDTLGVFQLDSSGIQSLVRLMQPDCFDDIMALVALYRPGPLGADMHVKYAESKHGRLDVVYDHPNLRPILDETYGQIVYQEQVLRMAVDIAGFTMSEADILRKAMGKKKPKIMAEQKQKFVDGSVDAGYDRSFAEQLFHKIEAFADYGFNKSHSCGYGLLAYQTAWLKANYPVEYLAALLTSVKSDKDRLPLYLNECRRLGITVLLPDVNESDVDFTPRGDDIRFGLSALRGLGQALVELIIAARREKGRFEDFRDFCDKVDAGVLNRRVIESLIKAGAFQGLGHTRKGLWDSYEQIVSAVLAKKRAESAGQESLFGGNGGATAEFHDGVVIGDDEFGRKQLLTFEREMLGLYVSDHPLFGAEEVLAQHSEVTLARLTEIRDGQRVKVAGVLTGLTKKFSRKGEPYLQAVIEDLTRSVEVTFWPSVFADASEVLVEDAVLALEARVENHDEVIRLVANEVFAPDLTAVRNSPLTLCLDAAQCTNESIERLKAILADHPGDLPVDVILAREGDVLHSYRLGERFRVSRRGQLMKELTSAFGAQVVGNAQRAGASV